MYYCMYTLRVSLSQFETHFPSFLPSLQTYQIMVLLTHLESIRVTLWIDPEPISGLPINSLDQSDAASSIRINLSALDSSSTVTLGDLLEIVPLLNPVASTAEQSLATPDRWNSQPGFLFTVRSHNLARQQGLQVRITSLFQF